MCDSASLPPYTLPSPTQEKLDFVKLVNIDLAKFDDEEGRKEIARDLYNAAVGHGFLTLTNHGISDEVYMHQMQLANAVMTLPPEEKAPYEVTPEEDARGLYVGFKPAGPLGHKGGFPKQLDHYNILVHDPKSRSHPKVLQPHMKEVFEVMHFIRTNILKKLLILLAMILEVPQETVLATHAEGGSKTEYIRYMSCAPRRKEDSEKYRDIFLAGHTDWGTWTFLFSQPVSALQVLDKDGEFKWVEYLPKALVVNFGEALELLTGGLFKATIHRVIQPPVDQRHLLRIGVIYFARPTDERELVPIKESPLLQRLRRDQHLDDLVFCMADYLDARKHGYKRLDFDIDRPSDETHADFFDGEYPDPEGHKSLGKFDGVPRVKYVPIMNA